MSVRGGRGGGRRWEGDGGCNLMKKEKEKEVHLESTRERSSGKERGGGRGGQGAVTQDQETRTPFSGSRNLLERRVCGEDVC